MAKAKIAFEEDSIYSSVIKPVKEGKFLCVLLKKKSDRSKLIKLLRRFKIEKKRGLYGFNGYVALVYSLPVAYNKYFDSIIEIN